MNFEPTGDLLSDLSLCIENSTAIQFDYVDRKGNATTRHGAPREIRADKVWVWDFDKHEIRMFTIANIGSFTVLDETFDPNNLT